VHSSIAWRALAVLASTFVFITVHCPHTIFLCLYYALLAGPLFPDVAIVVSSLLCSKHHAVSPLICSASDTQHSTKHSTKAIFIVWIGALVFMATSITVYVHHNLSATLFLICYYSALWLAVGVTAASTDGDRTKASRHGDRTYDDRTYDDRTYHHTLPTPPTPPSCAARLTDIDSAMRKRQTRHLRPGRLVLLHGCLTLLMTLILGGMAVCSMVCTVMVGTLYAVRACIAMIGIRGAAALFEQFFGPQVFAQVLKLLPLSVCARDACKIVCSILLYRVHNALRFHCGAPRLPRTQ